MGHTAPGPDCVEFTLNKKWRAGTRYWRSGTHGALRECSKRINHDLHVCQKLRVDKLTPQALKGQRVQITPLLRSELSGTPRARASGPTLLGFLQNSTHPSLDTYCLTLCYKTFITSPQQAATWASGNPTQNPGFFCVPQSMLSASQ